MDNTGMDDSKFVSAMCRKRTDLDMKKLRDAYSQLHGRNLIEDIKEDTTFHFKKSLMDLCTPQCVTDVHILYDATTKGDDTNEEAISHILCLRSAQEINVLKRAYTLEHDEGLEFDIKEDTSGSLQRLYLKLLQADRPDPGEEQVESDMGNLFGQDGTVGANEEAFVDCIAGTSYDYVRRLDDAYQTKFKRSLSNQVKKEFKANLQHAMLVLVTPRGKYWAGQLRRTMQNIGSNSKFYKP